MNCSQRLRPSGRAPGKRRRPLSRVTNEVFDERAALAYAGGDRRLLAEVIELFRSDYPASLRQIDRALRRHDSEALRMAAHRLKGAVATVGAPAGRQAAAELEQKARAGDFTGAEQAYAKLRAEIGNWPKRSPQQAWGRDPRASRKRVRHRPGPVARRHGSEGHHEQDPGRGR